MKLFYCKECDRYYAEAAAKVEVRLTVKLGDGDFWISSEDIPYGKPVRAYSFECIAENHDTVLVVDVDVCPHDWTESSMRQGYRRCQLCGITQQGRIVYD